MLRWWRSGKGNFLSYISCVLWKKLIKVAAFSFKMSLVSESWKKICGVFFVLEVKRGYNTKQYLSLLTMWNNLTHEGIWPLSKLIKRRKEPTCFGEDVWHLNPKSTGFPEEIKGSFSVYQIPGEERCWKLVQRSWQGSVEQPETRHCGKPGANVTKLVAEEMLPV